MSLTTLKPGAYVGRYRVEALVEQGGMGEVFRAFDPMLERVVAVKSIRLDMRKDFAALERFKREAKTLAQLNHPNICQVYDWVESEGATYMAMEWVPGVQLTQEMAKPLTLARILNILETIGEALKAAHAHQIVHRDLKPGNIVLLPQGGLKVLDFGLAKSADEAAPGWRSHRTGPAPNLSMLKVDSQATQTLPIGKSSSSDGVTEAGSFVGTLGYLSPEQVNRDPVGPPSDIFVLGILAHELLTGHKPFEGPGLSVLKAVARNERIPLPPLRSGQRWPRKLTRLLDGMLKPAPAQRLRAHEVVEALKSFQRPLARGWIASLSAAGALLLAGGIYLLRDRGVIADLTRERPARIAILPLGNGTGEPKLDAVIRIAMTEMMGAALKESPKLEVIDPEAVAKACDLQKIDPQRPLDGAQAQRLARSLGSKLFLVGEVSRDGQGHLDTFSYALLDPNGKPRHNGSVQQKATATFLPNALLVNCAAALLKAVDPHGKGQKTSTEQLPPQALEAFAHGMELYWKGDYRKAEPFLQQSAYAAPHMARGVASYARCLQRLSKGEALPAAQWAMLAAQKAQDHSSEATTFQLMGDLARERGDRSLAHSYLEQALELGRQARDQDRESMCWKMLGLLAQDEGKLEEAESLFQKALLISRATGTQRLEVDFLNNMANLALGRGDLVQAESRYREILKAYQSMESRSGEALALNNLGVFLLTAQRMDEAEGPLQKALAIRTAIGDGRGEANTLRNLGILQQMKGAFSEARLTQQNALERSRLLNFALGEAHSLYRLADLDRLEGRFASALHGFTASATLFESRGGAADRDDALAGAAECQARARPARIAEAQALLKQAQGGKSPRTTALRARAWIHWAQGKAPAALQDLEAALRDPEHQAPEGLAEMGQTLRMFRKRATLGS